MIIHLDVDWDDVILERFALVIAQQSLHFALVIAQQSLHFALQLNWFYRALLKISSQN
jgi:hypothetical protein